MGVESNGAGIMDRNGNFTSTSSSHMNNTRKINRTSNINRYTDRHFWVWIIIDIIMHKLRSLLITIVVVRLFVAISIVTLILESRSSATIMISCMYH